VRVLRLRCPCGRNLADVVQVAGEVVSPRGYNGYTYRGLQITARPEVEYRVYGYDDPSPDRTDTYTCRCRSPRTSKRTVHTLTGRVVARLWDANAADPRRVVHVTITYD
jgi:hypothetical protein